MLRIAVIGHKGAGKTSFVNLTNPKAQQKGIVFEDIEDIFALFYYPENTFSGIVILYSPLFENAAQTTHDSYGEVEHPFSTDKILVCSTHADKKHGRKMNDGDVVKKFGRKVHFYTISNVSYYNINKPLDHFDQVLNKGVSGGNVGEYEIVHMEYGP